MGAHGARSFFDRVVEADFDHIRLPVSWPYHASDLPPYTISPTFFERIDWVLDQAETRGLKLILNIHYYDELNDDPVAEWPRALAIWEQISERYRQRGDFLYFEILNEPHGAFDDMPELLNQFMQDALAVIRSTKPDRKVLLGPAFYSSIEGLLTTNFQPPLDKNVIVTVHNFEPFGFTHQGASWVDPVPPIGPITDIYIQNNSQTAKPRFLLSKLGLEGEVFQSILQTEFQQVRQLMNAAAQWAEAYSVPFYLGEFGVYEAADMRSRVAWIRAVRSEAERPGIGWGYWDLVANFGVYNPDTDTWRYPLLYALIPRR